MTIRTTSLYQNDPACPKPDDFDYNVIIVGSGITGLSAAHKIAEKNCGISVLVLEGSDKIGGRLAVSGVTKGFFIDNRQRHINRLIRELGLTSEYRKPSGNEDRIYYSRSGPIVVRREKITDEIDDFVNRLDQTFQSSDLKICADYPEAKKLARMSFDAFIDDCITGSEARELMKAIVFSICGLEAASVSTLWFIAMAIGAGGLKRRIKFALGSDWRKFIPGGAEEILKGLWRMAVHDEGTKIQTNSLVKLIEFNDVSAYVSILNGEQYKCEYVIVAVPPPESSKIRILPANEEVLKNQISHEPGRATFFVAKYDEAWWQRSNYSGDILGSIENPSELRIVYEATCPPDLSPAFLAGFLKRSADEKTTHPLEALRNCWTRTVWGADGSALSYSTMLKHYAESKWSEEEEDSGMHRGGQPMSAMKPCHVKYHLNPMLTPHKRVYWACSEYARFWPGTMDGGVESGEYSACSILYQVRPQSLNSEELRFVTPKTAPVAARKTDLPLDLVALHFVTTGIVTAILIIYCKPVK
ncbi:amine oxidase [flavin-containing] A [Neodiprion fabricii]|uniref:amine oxidase [flavin-containing] A n=1 Tax=Neodiprion fabricii TaxID=2872261 RepID=UPI001ED95F6B|nr:amine oxidase [flavin-containing] A [Neodiprion fabricii]